MLCPLGSVLEEVPPPLEGLVLRRVQLALGAADGDVRAQEDVAERGSEHLVRLQRVERLRLRGGQRADPAPAPLELVETARVLLYGLGRLEPALETVQPRGDEAAHGEGVEIITTFTDKEGNPVKQIGIFPANTITFTNLTPDTDKSVTVVTSGTFQVRAEPDGSISVKITGHGPFVPNPITGEPGIWYLSGRAFATFDAEGNPTSADLKGSLVNLCAQLA